MEEIYVKALALRETNNAIKENMFSSDDERETEIDKECELIVWFTVNLSNLQKNFSKYTSFENVF